MKRIINKLIIDKKTFNKAFTLVELMVVISIFLLVTGVTIFNYGSFRSNVSLQNLTDDIAMSIRKAQSFAIGARGNKIGTNTDFTSSYGVHFSSMSTTASPLNGNSKSFLIFAIPSSSTKKYDYSGSGKCGESANACKELFQINTSDYIKGFSFDSGDMVNNNPDASLDITFTRPDVRASFCFRHQVQNVCDPLTISSVSIYISNGQPDIKEKTKIITVANTGQISIKDYTK